MARPDRETVAEVLARARRRVARQSASFGAAAGLGLAALAQFADWPTPGVTPATLAAMLLAAVAGALVARMITSLRGRPLTAVIEASVPESLNLVFTAAELLQQEVREERHRGATATPAVAALVYRDAAALLTRLDLSNLFPARLANAALAGAVVLAILSLVQGPVAAELSAGSPPTEMIHDLSIAVVPPSYLPQDTTMLRDPERVQALAGSTLLISAQSGAATLSLETLAGAVAMSADGIGTFSAAVLADADGFLALEGRSPDGRVGPRRLIGLSVAPDLPPQVAITKPGEDLHLLDGNKTLNVRITATDDIGLTSLRLRYVRVSGSGERYTFTEGEVPLTFVRTDATHWQASTAWRLNALALEAGDVVVYRALVTDARPGAPPTESDAYLAEVLAPGSIAGGGFDTDPEVERYALSQQMIILKTERLLASRKTMTADSFADKAADIGVEQRSVRATFVFMMGGEIAAAPVDMTTLDEEAEAAGEGDILAGHSRNQGRDALTRATRAMSRASTLLIEGDAVAALPLEREALAQLERAFAHSRILLRALSVQERLDLSRRLTGVLVGATSQSRPVAPAASDPRIIAARGALASIAAVVGGTLSDTSQRTTARLAETVLRIDPSAAPLQQVAARLSQAATALGAHNEGKWRGLLDQAAVLLAAHLNALLAPVAASPQSSSGAGLRGALTDALRRGGMRQ